MEDFGVGAFFAAMFGFLIVALLIAVVFYVLMAIGLSKIAKREGLGDKAFLAWIPIGNSILLAMLVEDDVHESLQGKFALVVGISLIASVLLAGIIPFVAMVPQALLIYGFYYIAKRYSTNEVAHTILGFLLGTVAISLFMFRDRERLDDPSILE